MGYRTEYPSQEELRQVFRYENGDLYWAAPGGKRDLAKPAGSIGTNGYRVISYNYNQQRHRYLAHRFVWIWHHGNDPDTIDHINRNRSDNRIENLRDVSLSINHMNRCDTHTKNSLPRGVTYVANGVRKKYKAQRRVNGKQTCIGIYETPNEAAIAYRAFSLGAGLPVFDD